MWSCFICIYKGVCRCCELVAPELIQDNSFLFGNLTEIDTECTAEEETKHVKSVNMFKCQASRFEIISCKLDWVGSAA